VNIDHTGTSVRIVALVLSACVGQMLPGTIASADGVSLPFEIETSYGSGKVRATHPSTGEAFSGTYVGVREVKTAFVSSAATATGTPAFGTAAIASNLANANATLRGDRGSVLQCVMQIQAGLRPRGIGRCQDNHGKSYQLQF
jgi:hypothetical protein